MLQPNSPVCGVNEGIPARLSLIDLATGATVYVLECEMSQDDDNKIKLNMQKKKIRLRDEPTTTRAREEDNLICIKTIIYLRIAAAALPLLHYRT